MNNYDVRLRNCLKAVLELKDEDVNGWTMDTQLMSMGLNSISFIKVVVAIENEFDFELNDENLDFRKFKTYADIIKLLEEEVGNS